MQTPEIKKPQAFAWGNSYEIHSSTFTEAGKSKTKRPLGFPNGL